MRILLLVLCLQSMTALAAPRVVTSVVPLQELTAAIMDGVGEPEAIIQNEAAAHHFALKPSHLRRLQQADLVIWIDRHFEHGFNRIPDILPASTARLELLPALAIRNGDGHIWYSTRNLGRSASFILRKLIELDPVNRPVYEENAAALRQALRSWRRDAAQRIPQSPRVITDHRFLDHFVNDLGLSEIHALHDQHDNHGGLQALRQIESYLSNNPISCLLSLDENPSAIARTLAQKYGLSFKRIAIDTAAGPRRKAIFRRLDQLAQTLQGCR